MKLLILSMFFGLGAFFAAPTDLSPNLEYMLTIVSKTTKIHPAFLAAVINTANPDGEIPDSFDLFNTGESYTSTASSLIHFIGFLKRAGIDGTTLQNDPVESVRILSRQGIITDSTAVLLQLEKAGFSSKKPLCNLDP